MEGASGRLAGDLASGPRGSSLWAKRVGRFTNSERLPVRVATRQSYAFPIIGEVSVENLFQREIEEVLRPILKTKREKARRVLPGIRTSTCGEVTKISSDFGLLFAVRGPPIAKHLGGSVHVGWLAGYGS